MHPPTHNNTKRKTFASHKSVGATLTRYRAAILVLVTVSIVAITKPPSAASLLSISLLNSFSTRTINNNNMSDKKAWKVFWDLQCPYSKKNWENLAAIQAKLGADYDFSIHITSLLFHPQAFTAQCAASLIETKKGPQAKRTFIDACFRKQDTYMNAAVGDARKSEIDAIFANIAEESGLLDDETLTKDEFLVKLHDWELAIKPAWTEHTEALALGVFSTPKHVIDGELIADTDSSWGPDEFAAKLK